MEKLNHIMVWIKRCEPGGIKKDRQAFLSTPGGLDISQNKNLVYPLAELI